MTPEKAHQYLEALDTAIAWLNTDLAFFRLRLSELHESNAEIIAELEEVSPERVEEVAEKDRRRYAELEEKLNTMKRYIDTLNELRDYLREAWAHESDT